MSVGRYAMRGRAFQGRAFAARALANSGEAVTATDPNDGWIANSRGRVSTAVSRARMSISESRNRVWIAEDKLQ